MSGIRYVCLSDTHLGEEDSLLTYLKREERAELPPENEPPTNPLRRSPVLGRLAECLRELISKCNGENEPKPTLILNGDVLELALAETSDALMTLDRLVEALFPPGEALFHPTIFYVPGNHDHHLWELAREEQYFDRIASAGIGEKVPLTPPWHTTDISQDTVQPRFLEGFVRRYGDFAEDIQIHMAYPNLAFRNADMGKLVIFHHGHFTESIYMLMSHLKARLLRRGQLPKTVEGIEAENFAWIDFFWSMLGRSGEVGEDIETLYDMMEDAEGRRKLASLLAPLLADALGLKGCTRKVVGRLVARLARRIVDRLNSRERKKPRSSLSSEARAELATYVEGALREQILADPRLAPRRTVSEEVTLVFGHTHKPFEQGPADEKSRFDGYALPLSICNTGGWVVEPCEPKERRQRGATVALLDEDLNGVALRMYDECRWPEPCPVEARGVTRPGGGDNALLERVRDIVKPDREPWWSFAGAVATALKVRTEYLKQRIREGVR